MYAGMKNEVFYNKNNLRLNCPNAEEIYVEEATYGRMEKEVYKTSDYKIGRKATCKDVIPKLNKRCATKSSCNGKVAETLDEIASSCPTGTDSYLNVTYSCLQGKKKTFCSQRINPFVFIIKYSKIIGKVPDIQKFDMP